MARLLRGGKAARDLMEGLQEAISRAGRSRPPHLVVVRAGDDPASSQYVRAIQSKAGKVGIHVTVRALPADVSTEAFLDAVDVAGHDPDVDAVQVQKPIPGHLHVSEVLERIPARKDVEGVHPENQGLLLLGRPRFVPCTAAAVVRLLMLAGVAIEGVDAAVIGRSDIVGKPLATLLLTRHATVTVCHRITRDLEAEVRRAGLVIAAAGSPELVKADWIREGAVVVDVGHHVLSDGRTVGDVEAAAATRAGAITPVPGGVGPLTVVELLGNVLAAWSG